LNPHRIIFFLCLSLVLLWGSCNRDRFATDPSLRLGFSRTDVLFDSTFTQIGTTTEVFMVRNATNRDLLIDRIFLAGGSQSRFRLIADGEAGPVVEDLEIASGDSLYIFVECTIDPTGSNGDLFVTDSVMFSYNGNLDAVRLFAAGDDAIYLYPNDTLNLTNGGKFAYRRICNETWIPGKPYVVIGRAVVDSDCRLTVMPGTQVHFFKDADLWIFQDATFQVLGESTQPVLFTGTNRMQDDRGTPGQWNGIVIFEGKTDNIIRNAKIQNAGIGLNMQPLSFYDASSPRQVTLENVIIENMTSLGIYAQNFNLNATNLRVSNCGIGGVACVFGGMYNFTHCTFANYWPGQGRPYPSLLAGNGFNRNDTLYANDLSLRVYNSVITGSQINELLLDSVGGADFDYLFDHCAITVESRFVAPADKFPGVLRNAVPNFSGPFWNDYRLQENSPLRNKGNLSATQQNPKVWFDLEGKNRLLDGQPDLGAFER
jgi:hypothetical protein